MDTRRFDTKAAKPGGMKEGDTFIGCTSCSFIIKPGKPPTKEAPKGVCVECGEQLAIYKVTDSEESERVGNWSEVDEENS